MIQRKKHDTRFGITECPFNVSGFAN
jgi:hypothetical protein